MSNTLPPKPLPTITDQTRPFWAGAAKGSFLLQKCRDCGTFNFHPKPWCIECGSRALDWAPAQPYGTVYSYTISYAVAMNYPGWEPELPLILCLIDVDDGARMYAQVTDCQPQDMHIGMRVQVHCEAISDDAGIPKFRPLAQTAGQGSA